MQIHDQWAAARYIPRPMKTSDQGKDAVWRGPSLHRAPQDDEALHHLRDEQLARVRVVQQNGIWEWFSTDIGWGRCLPAMYGTLAFLALLPIAVLTAGFTSGWPLVVLLLLAALALIPQFFIYLPLRRRLVRRLRRLTPMTAALIDAEPQAMQRDDELQRGAWLLLADTSTLASIDALVDAADRLRDMVHGRVQPPDDLATFVAEVRQDIQSTSVDGSRRVVPSALGRGIEYARVRISVSLLPDECVTARLLFVLADPEDMGPACVQLVQSSLWGNGAEELCARFPLKESA